VAEFWVIAESFLIVLGLKFIDMTLSTLFTNFLVRGRKLYTFIFGFLEVIVYLVSLSRVLSSMDIYKMLGYAIGYATGALFGIWLEQKLAIGNQTWLIIPNENAYRLAYHLRDRGLA